MHRDEIIRLAMDLGSSIAQSDELLAVRRLQDQLQADETAFGLVMKYQALRMNLENKQRNGLEATPEEQNQLSIVEQQMQNNALIQQGYGCTRQVQQSDARGVFRHESEPFRWVRP